MAVRIRFRKFYECDTEADRTLDFGADSLIFCLDTQKYYKIYNSNYEEVLPEDVIFTSPIPVSKLLVSGTPDGTKFLRDDGSWELPLAGTPIAGGVNGSVQFNDNGVIIGESNFLYNNTTNVLSLESLLFAQTPTASIVERQIQWNDSDGTLEIGLPGGTLAADLISGYERVVNKTGSTLLRGKVVYINGNQGNRPTVTYSTNTGEAGSARTFGVLLQDISDNGSGYVIKSGLIKNINTVGYTAGQTVYLGTNGDITGTKPVAPAHMVSIGKVIDVGATGSIYIIIQNGFEIDELHDVLITSPLDKHVLYRDASTNLWKNATIANVLGYTPENTANKGVANGYASLDASGKVPISQLPAALMEYKGVWNAAINDPTLANGVGDIGDVWRVGTSGTTDFGSGPIAFNSGDYVIYNGSTWERSGGGDAVDSVNGKAGIVVLYTDDISEDGSPVNLWFTNARARNAISLTTTGTGAATYDSLTGVLNIPDAMGHDIQDDTNTTLPLRPLLKFSRLTVSDEPTRTVVTRPADTFVGTTAPSNPFVGDVWTDSNTWKTYKYYGGAWVEVGIYINPDFSSLVPKTRILTINGVAYDLSEDRTWTIAGGGGGGVEADTLSSVTARGNTTSIAMILSNNVPLELTGSGTGAYTKGVIANDNVNGLVIEGPLDANTTSGNPLPLTLSWRYGYDNKGGLRLTGGSVGYLGGHVILHANNYTTYTVTKTGGGASGNWAIDITGSAQKLLSQGTFNQNTLTVTRGETGLNLYNYVGTSSPPVIRGNLLHMYAAAGAAQILFGNSDSNATYSSTWIRSKTDNDTGAWSDWKEVITGDNIGTQSVAYAVNAGNAATATTAANSSQFNSLTSGQFIRSDANTDVTQTFGPRFKHTLQTDTNDGYIAAAKFASGLNIVGTQTEAGEGRIVRIWGKVLTDTGDQYVFERATPTWSISISGNAATATNATTANSATTAADSDKLDGLDSSAFALASHTHPYLPLAGGNMTGDIAFGSSTKGVTWAANTDGASITFQSSDDGATGSRANSNLLIALTDNGNEGVSITSAGTEFLYMNPNLLQYKGNNIWHAGNDGAGSGLDADTLDGYNSATSGANILLRTDGSGYLVHENWIRVGNNTGLYNPAGAYFYHDASFGWFSRSSINGSSSIRLQTFDGVSRGWLYANTSAQGFLSTGGSWRLTVYNSGSIFRDDTYTMWDSGNHGSGSGLDADLLDGYQASAFLRALGNPGNLNNASADGTYWWSDTSSNYPSSSTYGSIMQVTGGIGWYNQLAFGTDKNTLAWRSSINNLTTWDGWKTIWHSGNIGVPISSNADTANANGYNNVITGTENDGVLPLLGFRNSVAYPSNSNPFYFYIGNATNSSLVLEVNGQGAGFSVDYLQNIRIYKSLAVGSINPNGTTGRIDASNDIVAYSTSDMRLKENINELEDALKKVTMLSGVSFKWIDEHKSVHGYEGNDIGVIAQEVQAILPEAVRTNDSGYLSVRYEKLVPLLIQAIKEQQLEIREIKTELEILRNQ